MTAPTQQKNPRNEDHWHHAYSCLAGIRQRHNSVVEGLLPDELLRADISIQTHRGTLVRAMMLWVCGDVTEAQLIQLGLEDLVR